MYNELEALRKKRELIERLKNLKNNAVVKIPLDIVLTAGSIVGCLATEEPAAKYAFGGGVMGGALLTFNDINDAIKQKV